MFTLLMVYLNSCISLFMFCCVCVSLLSYRKMMEVCGDAENKLAYEQSQLEVQLERDILEPLNQLAEVTTRGSLRSCNETLSRLLGSPSSASFCSTG